MSSDERGEKFNAAATLLVNRWRFLAVETCKRGQPLRRFSIFGGRCSVSAERLRRSGALQTAEHILLDKACDHQSSSRRLEHGQPALSSRIFLYSAAVTGETDKRPRRTKLMLASEG